MIKRTGVAAVDKALEYSGRMKKKKKKASMYSKQEAMKAQKKNPMPKNDFAKKFW